MTAKQELTIIANLLTALGDPPGIGLHAGTRYHLTTYGIWGFALISSPTWRSAIDVGLRYIDLTFAFCRIRGREQGQDMDLVLDSPDIPAALQRFVVERDSAAIQTIQHEVFASPIPIKHVSYVFPPLAAGVQRYTEIFGVTPAFQAPENAVGIDAAVLDLPLPQADEHTTAIAQVQCNELLERRHARTGLAGRGPGFAGGQGGRPARPRPGRRPAEHERPDAAPAARQRRGVLPRPARRVFASSSPKNCCSPVAFRSRRRPSGSATWSSSSFSQAFRRWKGVGPRAYRARQLQPLPERRFARAISGRLCTSANRAAALPRRSGPEVGSRQAHGGPGHADERQQQHRAGQPAAPGVAHDAAVSGNAVDDPDERNGGNAVEHRG